MSKPRHLLFLPILALSLCIFFGSFGIINAQEACSNTVPCPARKVCIPATGRCATPAVDAESDGSVDTGGGTGDGRAGTGGGTGDGRVDTGGGTSDGRVGTGQGTRLINPLKANSLQELLNQVLDAVISLGVIVLVLALVWVGFLFVASRGNEEKIRTARTALVWTVIGGIILLGAKSLSLVIQATATSLGSGSP